METNDFREALGPLYPELGAALPDRRRTRIP
jgi:hypothetical protein